MPQPAAGSRLGAAPTIVLSWTPPPQLTTARLTCLQRMEEVPSLLDLRLREDFSNQWNAAVWRMYEKASRWI